MSLHYDTIIRLYIYLALWEDNINYFINQYKTTTTVPELI
jgi:hypothetical protein